MPYDLFDMGEQGLSAFSPLFAPNAIKYQIQANPVIPDQDIWAFCPNHQDDLPFDFDTLTANYVQNNAATSATDTLIKSKANEHGEETLRQDDIQDIIETQYGQDERLSKLETTVQVLVQASPKFPKESVAASTFMFHVHVHGVTQADIQY